MSGLSEFYSKVIARVVPWLGWILGAMLASGQVGAAPETSDDELSEANEQSQVAAQAELDAMLPADWDAMLDEMRPDALQALVTVSVATGARDNVGLNPVAPQSAWFAETHVEALMLQQPAAAWQWTAMVDGVYRRYAENPVSDEENRWFGRGEVRWEPWSHLQLSAQAQGYWLDQVIDLSEGIGARTVVAVQARGGELGAGARLDLAGGWRIEGSWKQSRVDYRHVAEDHDAVEWGGELIWQPTVWVEAAVLRSTAARDYDSRGEATMGGRILADTRLSFDREREAARLTLKAKWHGEWRGELAAERRTNRDGASGFYDYDRDLWRGSIGWKQGPWDLRAEWETGEMTYRRQTVGEGLTPDARVQRDDLWSVEGARTWGEHWQIFGRFESDRSRSNEAEASYGDRTTMIGMAYTF